MRFIYYYDCIIIKSKKEYRRRRKRDLSFMLSGRKNKGSWRAKAKRLRFSRKGIPILNNAITTIKHILDTFSGEEETRLRKNSNQIMHLFLSSLFYFFVGDQNKCRFLWSFFLDSCWLTGYYGCSCAGQPGTCTHLLFCWKVQIWKNYEGIMFSIFSSAHKVCRWC